MCRAANATKASGESNLMPRFVKGYDVWGGIPARHDLMPHADDKAFNARQGKRVVGYRIGAIAVTKWQTECPEPLPTTSEQLQLSASILRRTKLRRLQLGPSPIEAELVHEEIERLLDSLRIRARCRASALPNSDSIKLAAAHFANQRLDPLGRQRAMLLQPGHKDRRDGNGQAAA